MLHAGVHDKTQLKDRLQKMIYIVWNIWKERCRRVYDKRALTADHLLSKIMADVQQWFLAWRSPASLSG
jgi:hypothetical protein